MQEFDIVIITEDRFVKQSDRHWQAINVWKEDQLVTDALLAQGFNVGRKSWSDSEFKWSDTKAAIFRSTWDYCNRFEEWIKWLDGVEGLVGLHFINPLSLVRWNMDKHYLRDLNQSGIHIPPTRFIEKNEVTSLKALHDESGWHHQSTILKPCFAGSARHTYKLSSESLQEHEATFQELISQEAMMLQPFLHNVVEEGEISLMIMGGRYTHAVVKRAKPGDFRVQDDFGGSVEPHEADALEIAFAEKVVQACDSLPAYARVDIVKDNEGQLALIELELIEPELWFRFHPEAATVLASHISSLLQKTSTCND